MGEIADQMISGSICELCLIPFIKQNREYEHGYPVVCNSCWNGLTADEKNHHQRQEKRRAGQRNRRRHFRLRPRAQNSAQHRRR